MGWKQSSSLHSTKVRLLTWASKVKALLSILLVVTLSEMSLYLSPSSCHGPSSHTTEYFLSDLQSDAWSAVSAQTRGTQVLGWAGEVPEDRRMLVQTGNDSQLWRDGLARPHPCCVQAQAGVRVQLCWQDHGQPRSAVLLTLGFVPYCKKSLLLVSHVWSCRGFKQTNRTMHMYPKSLLNPWNFLLIEQCWAYSWITSFFIHLTVQFFLCQHFLVKYYIWNYLSAWEISALCQSSTFVISLKAILSSMTYLYDFCLITCEQCNATHI